MGKGGWEARSGLTLLKDCSVMAPLPSGVNLGVQTCKTAWLHGPSRSVSPKRSNSTGARPGLEDKHVPLASSDGGGSLGI